MEIDFFKFIDIKRPIYFLCGPFNQQSKKRTVLSNYLTSAFNGKEIRPFPIIVDEIFSNPSIEKYKLPLDLLEEIVAAISFRTYIFLDTLSTAYELGLFRNSKSDNQVIILLENTYLNRERRTVGEYIRKSIKQDSILTYEGKEDKDKLEYFEFLSSSVSENISKHIVNEIDDYSKAIDEIRFYLLDKKKWANQRNNDVFVSFNERDVSVSFTLKSLFYCMSVFLDDRFTSYKQIVALKDKQYNQLINDFKKYILKKSLINLGSALDRITIHNQIDISIESYPKEKVDELIKTVYYLFVIITEGQKGKRLHKITDDLFEDTKKREDDSIFEFIFAMDQKISTNLYKTVHYYLAKPDNYIDEISYVINKKPRAIRKYKDNYKGKQLRYCHERIKHILDLALPSNSNSFAYKIGYNTLKCIDIHRDSNNFLKIDIHHYFDSIRFTRFYKLVVNQIRQNLKANGLESHHFFSFSELKIYLKSLFYKGRLPLGFITSPKVSDFYLINLDNWASTMNKIKYSRYADDILISCKDTKKNLKYLKRSIEKQLKLYKLIINDKKVIEKKLIYDGDCIKFLGINIVKKGDSNEIRISKSYLKETVKMCYQVYDSKDNLSENDQLIGRVRYIKNISGISFERLIKALSTNDKGKAIAERLYRLN